MPRMPWFKRRVSDRSRWQGRQGSIGNLAAQLMKCAGARQVIGIDPVDERLEIARRCGVDVTANPGIGNTKTLVEKLTGGKGCQTVVEATGAPEVANQALQVASEMGEVVLLGSPRGSAEIDLYFDLHRPGVSLIGAHGSRLHLALQPTDPHPTELMLRFIAQERLQIAPLITHVLPASQAQTAFDGLLHEKSNYLGVLLDLQDWD